MCRIVKCLKNKIGQLSDTYAVTTACEELLGEIVGNSLFLTLLLSYGPVGASFFCSFDVVTNAEGVIFGLNKKVKSIVSSSKIRN